MQMWVSGGLSWKSIYDSSSQGHEFEPHAVCRDYLNFLKIFFEKERNAIRITSNKVFKL